MGEVSRLRKRAEQERAVALDDAELVLARPQHYHLTLECYRELTEDGKGFTWATTVELVANDVELAKAKAKRLSGRQNVHVHAIRQCGDEAHLKGLPE